MIFDEFLKAGLIPIGGDDEVYKKLTAASKKLVEILKADKAKVINYTLVAIDSNITENEPVLVEVENIVTEEWKLIRSQFTEMPISIYRGIILQALEDLGSKDVVVAAAIWHSSCNLFSLLPRKERESDILYKFLHAMGDVAETKAIEDWSINKEPKGIRLPAFNLEIQKTPASVDLKELTDYLIAASGPSGEDGVARANPNPYWPNNNHNWAYQFSPRAAKGITSSVNKALTAQNNATNLFIESFQKQATEYFTKLKTDVSVALKESIQSSVAVEQRSQLLWWKETLYSKTLRKSYRELDEFENAIAMAYDLYNILPKHCPTSVMYILKETYNTIHSAKSKIKISEFINIAQSKKKKEFVNNFFENVDNHGRTDFDSYLSNVIFNNNSEEIISRLGINSDVEIEFELLSTWILNSLIAKYLIQ